MAQAICNGLNLEYETFGNQNDPTLVLIGGLGIQMIDWQMEFCETIAESGFQVVRFDNRDVGHSEKLDAAGVPDMPSVLADIAAGQPASVPYDLFDMAADTMALLDHLDIEKAHISGMSMGGMISQCIAITYPERSLSLTSIMSSSGTSGLPPSTPEANEMLMATPASLARDDVIALGRRVNMVLGSPGFRWDDADHREHIGHVWDRGIFPDGYIRQYAAVRASGHRTAMLPSITAPTLVIHGSDDPLLLPACGENTARLIPDADLIIIPGMGHDLSPALCRHMAPIIVSHIQAA